MDKICNGTKDKACIDDVCVDERLIAALNRSNETWIAVFQDISRGLAPRISTHRTVAYAQSSAAYERSSHLARAWCLAATADTTAISVAARRLAHETLAPLVSYLELTD
jgi:hypothetical protein